MAIELFKYPTLYNDANLQNYYRLEGNSTDVKGGKNGTDTNIAYGDSYGKFGQGALFNGSTSKITTSLWTSATTNITVGCWVNPSSISQIGSFIHNGTSSNGWGMCIAGATETGGNHVGLLRGGAGYSDLGEAFPSANQWYFVVLTRGATTWKAYVNGVQTANTATGNPNTPTTNTTVGIIGSSYPFSGNIDDIYFFNRELSATEVLNLYNKVLGVKTNWFF